MNPRARTPSPPRLSAKAVCLPRRDHDALQEVVPSHRMKVLHVNTIVHGRDVCPPLRPQCGECNAWEICPQLGVEQEKVLHAD